jgi:hypothetical protein
MNVKWNLLWTFTAPESDWIELDMLQHFTSRNSQTKNTYWYTRKLIKLKITCAFYFVSSCFSQSYVKITNTLITFLDNFSNWSKTLD